MGAATVSRVRLRNLPRLGRSGHEPIAARGAPLAPSASRRQSITDAGSIGDGLPPRPRAGSPRPGTGDLMAPPI